MRRDAEHMGRRACGGRARVLCVAATLSLLAGLSPAQDDDVPLPPRIDARGTVLRPLAAPTPPLELPTARGRPPNAARLAPLPDERGDAPGDGPEEIIVIGGWRLPDLGSGWREKQEEQMRSGRARATLLPLYDPTKPPARSDGLWLSREAQRVGYIEVFRFRFGRRSDE
jgi:hypothetical protein